MGIMGYFNPVVLLTRQREATEEAQTEAQRGPQHFIRLNLQIRRRRLEETGFWCAVMASWPWPISNVKHTVNGSSSR